ncbi:ATP-dependent Clp protease adaptor ClpS [bacterium]|nr:ATP-dependent Clp protease adaptor ClpS [bacterium]
MSVTHPSTPVKPVKREVELDLSQLEPWREFEVILFNDEDHSMDEVIGQIVKALQCSFGCAQAITFEAHTQGQALVAVTSKPNAVQIASVLRQIDLRVSLRQIN